MVRIEYIVGNNPEMTADDERSALETLMKELAVTFKITPYKSNHPSIQVGYEGEEVVIRPFGCKIDNVFAGHNIQEDEMEAVNPRTIYLPTVIQNESYSARIEYTPLIPDDRL